MLQKGLYLKVVKILGLKTGGNHHFSCKISRFLGKKYFLNSSIQKLAPNGLYMQSKFGAIVCSICEVISLEILKMTPPEFETGGKFQKSGNGAMFPKGF